MNLTWSISGTIRAPPSWFSHATWAFSTAMLAKSSNKAWHKLAMRIEAKKRAWVKLSKAFCFEQLRWTGLVLAALWTDDPKWRFFSETTHQLPFFFIPQRDAWKIGPQGISAHVFFSLSEGGLSYVSTSHFLKLCFVCIMMELPTFWRCAQWKILMSMFDFFWMSIVHLPSVWTWRMIGMITMGR